MSQLQDLPQLTFAVRPIPSHKIGAEGELMWLPLEKLRVDPTYQRAVLDSGKANIRRMVEGFSWLLFGTITVARRPGGLFAVIDGQHRTVAATLHPQVTHVPALVLTGGPEAEARAFSAINGNRTSIHALQSFRASVAAGDVAARELVQLCARGGATIAPYPKTELLPGETLALGALRTCAKRDGEEVLVAALKLLRALDPDAGLSAPAIVGTSAMLKEKREWCVDAVALGARVTVPGRLSQLSDKARTRRASYGGPEWSSFKVLVRDLITMAQRAGNQDMKRLMGGK